MKIRLNTLSIATKLIAVFLVVWAVILELIGYTNSFRMSEVVMGATFIAGAFLPIDISKIKTSHSEANNVG